MIGAGNVATHLAPVFCASGAGEVVQVYSRTLGHAEALAGKMPGATATDSIADLRRDADIYVISVKDDAIAQLVAEIEANDALWLHTSGSVGMEVLAPLSARHGVFYPLQTFSKDVELDMERVPIFIEGANEAVESEIRAFASRIFSSVYHADSELRKKMHISAVFACNFTNYLWTIAARLLAADKLPFSVLQPLLEETLRKALVNSPASSQTGPAARGDRQIIDAHLNLLEGENRELYSILSEAIIRERK